MIYVFVPDADGCLFHRTYRKSLNQDVVAHNRELLNFVAQQAIGSSQFVVLVGSNRQSQEIDQMCRQATKTGSVFSAISAVSTHLEATLNTFLLADIFFDRISGKSFEQALYSSYKSGKFFYIDNTKLILLYAQMQHLANAYPREKIIFDFYDDRGLIPEAGKEILEHLDEFFSRYPDMIPMNVTLRLNLYGDAKVVTHIKQIGGTGIIDANYRNTVKAMYQMTIERQPATKEGLIYSASQVQPELLSCRSALTHEGDLSAERKSSSDPSTNDDFETIELDIVVTDESIEASKLIVQERSSSIQVSVGSVDSDINLISVDLGDKSPRSPMNAAPAKKKFRWCCCLSLFSSPKDNSSSENETKLVNAT